MDGAGVGSARWWRRLAMGLCVVGAAVSLVAPPATPVATRNATSGMPLAAGATLRELADAAGIRFGATLEPGQITDSAYAGTLAGEFNALTAENAMKWYSIQAERGTFDFAGGDAVLAFAESHDMEVRGHNLVWEQDQYTPAWVKEISDPDELRAVLFEHIDTVLDHYRGRIHRWDVVNEPLASVGAGPSDSVFARVLGPGWLAEALRHARDSDPSIEIWVNEFGSDWVPGKHQALVALLAGLLDDGVPLDGVGLQTHRLSVDGPDPASFRTQLQDYADLGLRVAITELDVATNPADPDGLARQAAAYETIVRSCLSVAACEEVTLWGVTDRDTWLDANPLLEAPTRPLLFDDDFRPKPAYAAVARALADGRSQPPLVPPSVPSTTTTAAGSGEGAPAEAIPGQVAYTG